MRVTAFPKTPVQGATSTRPKYTWDGWNLVKEDDGTNVFRWYCPQGEILSFERNSTFYQVHRDALGSIRAITDSTGAVAGSYTYGAWGEMLSASHPSGFTMPYLFVGALGVRFDSTTGLHYMRNRWYDAGLGRFISRDPIFPFSDYLYADNNPLDRVDPIGLDWSSGLLWGTPAISNPRGFFMSPLMTPKDFAKSSRCCEAAKYFGLNGAVVCSMLYHEFSFYNLGSLIEDEYAKATGKQLGNTLGPFGLSPKDVRQLVRRSGELGPIQESYLKALYGSVSDARILSELQNMQDAAMLFSGLQALRVKAKHWEGLSSGDLADNLMNMHNPGVGLRSRIIRYKSIWDETKGGLLSTFQDICDDDDC